MQSFERSATSMALPVEPASQQLPSSIAVLPDAQHYSPSYDSKALERDIEAGLDEAPVSPPCFPAGCASPQASPTPVHEPPTHEHASDILAEPHATAATLTESYLDSLDGDAKKGAMNRPSPSPSPKSSPLSSPRSSNNDSTDDPFAALELELSSQIVAAGGKGAERAESTAPEGGGESQAKILENIKWLQDAIGNCKAINHSSLHCQWIALVLESRKRYPLYATAPPATLGARKHPQTLAQGARPQVGPKRSP